MIYLTGDTHGYFEKVEAFCEMYETTEEDILIILGDVGINYYLDQRDRTLKESLYQMPITLLCIHGNHEERPEESNGDYEEKTWHEGKVYYEEEYPNILFAIDGEIYDFDGKKAIAIGGAYSIDKFFRLENNAPWFPTEQPDDAIKDKVEKKLESVNWQVDYVLSHTGPLLYLPEYAFSDNIDERTIDKSTEEWLSKIEEKLDYENWYFGHFHIDSDVGKAFILYEETVELGE